MYCFSLVVWMDEPNNWNLFIFLQKKDFSTRRELYWREYKQLVFFLPFYLLYSREYNIHFILKHAFYVNPMISAIILACFVCFSAGMSEWPDHLSPDLRDIKEMKEWLIESWHDKKQAETTLTTTLFVVDVLFAVECSRLRTRASISRLL